MFLGTLTIILHLLLPADPAVEVPAGALNAQPDSTTWFVPPGMRARSVPGLAEPSARDFKLELADVDWQPLPADITSVRQLRSDQVWLFVAPPREAPRPAVEQIIEDVRQQMQRPIAQWSHGHLLHQDSTGRIWLLLPEGHQRNLLIGVGEQEAIIQPPPMIGEPIPTATRWNPVMAELDGRLLFFTDLHAVTFDGQNWDVKELRKPGSLGLPVRIFRGGSDLFAAYMGKDPALWRYADGEWAQVRLPEPPDGLGQFEAVVGAGDVVLVLVKGRVLQLPNAPAMDYVALVRKLDDPDQRVRDAALRELRQAVELDIGRLQEAAARPEVSQHAQMLISALIYDAFVTRADHGRLGRFSVGSVHRLEGGPDGLARVLASHVRESVFDGDALASPQPGGPRDVAVARTPTMPLAILTYSPETREWEAEAVNLEGPGQDPEAPLYARVSRAREARHLPEFSDEQTHIELHEPWVIVRDAATGAEIARQPLPDFRFPVARLEDGTLLLANRADSLSMQIGAFRPRAPSAPRLESGGAYTGLYPVMAVDEAGRIHGFLDQPGHSSPMNTPAVHDGRGLHTISIERVVADKVEPERVLDGILAAGSARGLLLLQTGLGAALHVDNVLYVYPSIQRLVEENRQRLAEAYDLPPDQRGGVSGIEIYPDQLGNLWVRSNFRLSVLTDQGWLSMSDLSSGGTAREFEARIARFLPSGDGRGFYVVLGEQAPEARLAFVSGGRLQTIEMPAPARQMLDAPAVYDPAGQLWVTAAGETPTTFRPHRVWPGAVAELAASNTPDSRADAKPPAGTLPWWRHPDGTLWFRDRQHVYMMRPDGQWAATLTLPAMPLQGHGLQPVADESGGVWLMTQHGVLHLAPSDHHEAGWQVDGFWPLAPMGTRHLLYQDGQLVLVQNTGIALYRTPRRPE